MRPIKVVQIGVGHDHAFMTFNSMVKQSDVFEVLGLAIPEKETEDFKEKIDNDFIGLTNARIMTVEDALNIPDLDAVAVECEEENALYYAQLFADKGVAVHLDKPGSADIIAFNRLADTLKGKDLVFNMGYMYRTNPVIQDAIKRVKNGELGEIFSVEAHMSIRHPKEKREWLGKYKGGMMYFLGCHLVDLVLQIQGIPEEIISYNTSTLTDGVQSEDLGFAVLKYKNGVSFVKANSSEHNGFDRRQLVITGSKGTIELRPLEVICEGGQYTPYKITIDNNKNQTWGDSSVIGKSETFDRYDTMMKNFAMYVSGEQKNPYTYDYEKQLFNAIMKCCNIN